MALPIFDHPVEQGIVVAGVTWIIKTIYDSFKNKNYISLDRCATLQQMCKQELTSRLCTGDEEFNGIDEQFKQLRETLAILAEIQLAICQNANMDCTDFVKKLVKKGIIQE